MRFEERDLNIYEVVLETIEAAKEKNKRIDQIIMSQAEFDDFYQLAMNHLPSTETAGFLNRKLVYGAQIVIDEGKKKAKKD